MPKKTTVKSSRRPGSLARTTAAPAAEVVRDLVRGTHVCMFYETPQDLIDVVVPYLRHGLEQNEFCVWVTGDLLSGTDAMQALLRNSPDLEACARVGQIEILDTRQWYLTSGKFEAQRVLDGWAEKERLAIERGYAGLRVTGDTSWLASSQWSDFVEYEAMVDAVIKDYRMIALCTYSMQKRSTAEVIEVVNRHRSALIRRDGRWDALHGGSSRHATEELAWLASFPELSPSPLVELDLTDGSVSYLNPAAKRLFPDLAVRGAAHSWLVGVPAIVEGLDESGAQSARREMQIGALYYEQVVSRAPGIRRTRVFGLDITERKEAERRQSLISEHMEELVARRTGQLETANAQLLTEIEERKRAEESLRESQERLAVTLEAAQVGLFDRNLVTNEIFWSPYHEVIFNYEPGVGRHSFEDFARRVHPEDLPWLEERARRSMATKTAFEGEYRLVWPDGSVHWVAGRYRYSYDAEGHAVRMMGIAIDITDRKRIQEELGRAKEIAVAANIAKSQFLANMSHELRTPMNAILGMTDLALAENLSPIVRDYLETSKQSAEGLLKILNDILDLSRIEAGGLQLESAPFELGKTVEHVVKMLGVLAYEKGLELVCDLGDAPGRLVGDSLRLRQVLANLVGNAVKFTNRGKVVVRAAVESLEPRAVVLRLAVADTGIGIEPEDQARIFSPFTRTEATTVRHDGGTGLGLTIAQRLVHLMGGRIWVESEPGQGSTFFFTVKLGLPTKAKKKRQKPASEHATLEPDRSNLARSVPDVPVRVLRVLVAEDNPANQKLVAYILGRRGHAVEVADNGALALDLIRRRNFDVILMDVQMPVMDGLRTTAALRKLKAPRKANLPVVAMTAHAFKSDEARCLAVGMDAYLSKPIKAERLIELVERLAEGAVGDRRGQGRAGDRTAGQGTEPPTASPSRDGSDAGAANETAVSDAAGQTDHQPANSFSLAAAVALCGGNFGLFQDMAEYFFQQVDAALESMRQALLRGDVKEFGRVAHHFKGTVCFLGAPAVMEALALVEQAGNSGELADASLGLEQLEQELTRLKAALQPHRKSGR
ncbi:MAG: MEDS domain-containing protein [Pirellulales bacterium]